MSGHELLARVSEYRCVGEKPGTRNPEPEAR